MKEDEEGERRRMKNTAMMMNSRVRAKNFRANKQKLSERKQK
jgi:hypothetical protein